ncbi:hypothetical protein HW115_00685 [Verrucomicrobiaceae bacterium N1E253]|uniref:DUF3108 domain-containing protein n=1 Tax=Oceaniferula marina TaxID=2748318 RepID=A0A851GHM1_9BACT|nr:hypothetical protein [Oceaniferula marina]NWK54110.1 hypothetical protein [Oceaniferula marina]
MMIYKILLLALVSSSLLSVGRAQSHEQNELGERMHAASLKFRTAGWKNIKEPLYYRVFRKKKGGGEAKQESVYKQTSLFEMEPSLVGQTFPGRWVSFYRKASVDGKDVYSLAAKARINPEKKRYLFLFFPKETARGKYKVYSIPDTRLDSPYGAYQFHNMTQLSMEGSIGKKKFKMSPQRKVHTLQFKYSKKTPLPFALYRKEAEKVEWYARNTYHFNPNKHLKLFVYSEKDVRGRPRVKVKGIVDFYEPPVRREQD